MRTRFLTLAMAACVTLAAPGLVWGQQGAGIRAGIRDDPTQFVFGGHVQTGPLLDRLVFRPNVEVGIGDDLVLVGLNLEFVYKIPIAGKPWGAYLGAGPALNVLSADDDGRGRDRTGAEGGFNILVGLEHRRGLFTEFKVGMAGSPDLTFVVGRTF